AASALSCAAQVDEVDETAEEVTVEELDSTLWLSHEDDGTGPAGHKLVAWAALPQEDRRPGPTSGQFTTPINGVTPPFVNGQPIPGFSAFLNNYDGTFLGMPDNGYGAKGNSADYVLGFYIVDPDFKRFGDGTTEPG